MNEKPAFVLDASALLAYLQGEPGASVVAEALVQGAAISAVTPFPPEEYVLWG